MFVDEGIYLPISNDLYFLANVLNGKVVALVAYNSFCGLTCQMHQVIRPHGITPRFLWAAFDYPFMQAGCVEVIGIVKASNAAALRMDRHLGFHEIYRVQDGWKRGEDMVVLTMKKSECKWLDLGRRFAHEYRKAA